MQWTKKLQSLQSRILSLKKSKLESRHLFLSFYRSSLHQHGSAIKRSEKPLSITTYEGLKSSQVAKIHNFPLPWIDSICWCMKHFKHMPSSRIAARRAFHERQIILQIFDSWVDGETSELLIPSAHWSDKKWKELLDENVFEPRCAW